MSDAEDRSDPFFIGWAAAPGRLRPFLAGVGLCLAVLFGGVGYIAAATQADGCRTAPAAGRRQLASGTRVELWRRGV